MSRIKVVHQCLVYCARSFVFSKNRLVWRSGWTLTKFVHRSELHCKNEFWEAVTIKNFSICPVIYAHCLVSYGWNLYWYTTLLRIHIILGMPQLQQQLMLVVIRYCKLLPFTGLPFNALTQEVNSNKDINLLSLLHLRISPLCKGYSILHVEYVI